MNASLVSADGSRSSAAPKIEPIRASIRRFHPTIAQSLNRWVAFQDKQDSSNFHFTHGVLTDVTFNGDAVTRKCGAMESSADATGLLYVQPAAVKDLMVGVAYTAHLEFKRELKSFVISGSQFVVTSCDYLVLQSDGKAIYGWKTKPVGAPVI